MISQEDFDTAVFDLAREDGTDIVLLIPGVWECVAEHYNNAAIDRVQHEEAENDDHDP